MPKLAPIAGAAGLLSLMLSSQALAGGFYIQEQSVKGLGRAYSGEASDIGPESLWWNPAAIGSVEGIQIYGGLHGVFSQSEVRDTGSTIQRPLQPATPVGGVSPAKNPLEPGAVPNLDAAWRVNPFLAVGLAVSAPFNFTTKYDGSSFVRYQALTSRLLDLDVQPTVALHLNPMLDVGIGFDAQYAQATLSSNLPNLSPLLPDGYNRLEGDGWNYGWTIGGQYRPNDKLTLGLSYRSQINHELDGTVQVKGLLGPLAAQNATLPGKAKFSTPWLLVFGGRYKLDDHWTLNAQIQRVGWSAFDSIRVSTLAGPTTIPQGYHDTTTGAVGVDYAVNPKWTVRGGIAYDPTPTPDIGRSARVPDGDRILFTIGTTYAPKSWLELHGAFAYVDLLSSRINSNATAYAGTPVVTPINYSAQITGDAFIVSSGLTVKF